MLQTPRHEKEKKAEDTIKIFCGINALLQQILYIKLRNLAPTDFLDEWTLVISSIRALP